MEVDGSEKGGSSSSSGRVRSLPPQEWLGPPEARADVHRRNEVCRCATGVRYCTKGWTCKKKDCPYCHAHPKVRGGTGGLQLHNVGEGSSSSSKMEQSEAGSTFLQSEAGSTSCELVDEDSEFFRQKKRRARRRPGLLVSLHPAFASRGR